MRRFDALDLAEMSFEGGGAGGDWSSIVPPRGSPEALHLRLSEPGSVDRRLEREAGRNVEVMWLLGRLAPDHKTIADFRKDNGLALRRVYVGASSSFSMPSEIWPDSGMVTNETTEAADTAPRIRLRDICDTEHHQGYYDHG